VLSDANARLAAARRLTSPGGRREAGRFLAEGAQSVREALAADAVVEIFGTAQALQRNAGLLNAGLVDGGLLDGGLLDGRKVVVSEVSVKAAASLSETITPQGLIAVCRTRPVSLDDALASRPRLVAILEAVSDPGNAGTIIRTAEAAGCEVVVFAGDTVDPHNGKCVRASAGSIFHLAVITEPDAPAAIGRCSAVGLLTLAASGSGEVLLDELADSGELRGPTAWVFGNEARGLSGAAFGAALRSVRVPIYGRAESLNLAAAAAVCLYTSAREQHRPLRPPS
jgi:TrmH family RNA methyltransferase